MLPKNPSKNKHSKCLTEEGAVDSKALPPDQFFTMLKEHQSSIINLEAKFKQMNKMKGNRNFGDEIDILKQEIEKKQDAETELLLRSEISRQEKEMKRLREECRQINENLVKSKFRGGTADVSKDVLDMRDQIVTLTNLVK